MDECPLRGRNDIMRHRHRSVALRMIGKADEDTPREASGAHWMSAGVQLLLTGDFQAAAAVFDRVAQ